MVDPALFLLVSAGVTLLFYWQQGNHRQQTVLALYALLGWTAVYLLGRYEFGLSQAWWPLLWGVVGWALVLWGMGISIWQVVLVALPPFILAFAFAEAITLSLLWGLVTAVPIVFLLASPQTRKEQEEQAVFDTLETPREMGHSRPANMQAVFDTLNEGIVVGDNHGRVIYANKHAAEVIGSAASDIQGQYIMDVLTHLPMITPADTDNSEDDPRTRFEMNGRLIQGQMHIIYDNQQQLQYSVAILHDITDNYQSQRAKTAFLTNISHELRTPLTAIKGYVELLESEVAGQLNAEQKMFVEIVHRNVMRMVQLINSLIFVSSVKSGSAKPRGAYADLRQLINQIVREQEPLALRLQQTILVEIDPQVTPIQADSIHISTVLQELLNNSIKFNQPGGKIWISVSQEKDGTDADFVVVQVRDEGIGIAPADQLHIFDEFYRAESADVETKGGMGVGLAIVRALVEAYNGRIWIDSDLGSGSTFTLLLPTKQNGLHIAPLTAVDKDITPV